MSLRRVHRTWERLAESDPLWAIASHPDKKGKRWQLDDFYRTGEETVATLMAGMQARGVTPGTGRALDFGCGVGRLTEALGERFDQVDGVDVSTRMIDLARRQSRHMDRCRYHASRSERLPFESETFDFVLSLITLQHMPPRLAAGYIREFLRVLRPGGVALFQAAAEPRPAGGSTGGWRRALKQALPSSLLHWIRSVRAGLRSGAGKGYEMHGLPREAVERVLHDGSATLLSLSQDQMAGAEWTSFTYTIRRA